ncbi:hypothetical protein LguiA_012219 [Lonicera macranthoides]
MDRVGGGDKASSPPLKKPSKFAVYQNPALSAALTSTTTLRPPSTSTSTFLFILSLSTASSFALFSLISRNQFAVFLKLRYISPELAYLFAKTIETMVGLFLLGTVLALIKAISIWRLKNVEAVDVSPRKGIKEQTRLTNRQLGLLGIMPKVEQTPSDSSKKPPKSKINSASPSNALVPLHQPVSSNRSSRIGGDNPNTSGGSKIHSFSTQSKSPASPSLYLAPAATLQTPSVKTSPGLEQLVATPWSSKRGSSNKEITTEEKLEQFLADIGNKISESASKLATPPPTVNGFGIASPSSANTSGTTRSTPLRPVRMSPGSQKFNTPPKKGEGELPPPMSMEESIEAFASTGIYPQIEQWRDRLRQWFSSVLLNPLCNKVENSHTKVCYYTPFHCLLLVLPLFSMVLFGSSFASFLVMHAAAKLALSALDEESLLHQLRATLVQALDASMSRPPLGHFQQSPQQPSLIPILQECIDTITEHQRLRSLMKGEWVKGLLPQSSVRADYTVQRIRELAEGTCVKNYEYLGSGEVYDKVNKKWTLELPTDSHLLLYLFCAFLEHPKWMLHVDPTSYAGGQSSKNPLFLGVLPPKERFPEKYVAAVSGVPNVLHPGATVLVVGKQSPPVFVLYWDKKAQFSLQASEGITLQVVLLSGRTALWDSTLLVCHRIKTAYGGIVRGMHLGSSALAILPILEPEIED